MLTSKSCRRQVFTLVAGFALLCNSLAVAAEWPTKPIRFVVPYGAGGAADTLARIFSESLGASLNAQIVVENRPGGGSVIGSEMVARSAPDGYTFTLAGMSTHVLAPAMNKNTGFDPIRDFTHVAYFGGAPNIFVVHPNFGATSLKEFLAKARAAKDGIDYVSPGVGSVGNLVAEYFAAKEKIKLNHVAYKGGASALLDLVAGHVQVGMMSASTAGEHARAGKLIPIAVSSAERLKDFPDLPTLKELGYPDLVATTWWALSAPAGLPPEITARVNAAVNASFDQPKVRRNLEQDAVEAKAMTPAELTVFVKAEVDKWTPFVRSLTAK